MVYSFICDIRNKELNTASLEVLFSKNFDLLSKNFQLRAYSNFFCPGNIEKRTFDSQYFLSKKNAVSFIIPSDFRDTNELINNWWLSMTPEVEWKCLNIIFSEQIR